MTAARAQGAGVFRPVGHHDKSACLRHDGEEVGKQGLAHAVDPVRVLDHVDGGRRPVQGGRVHHRGQPPASGVGVDLRDGDVRVTDSQHVVEENDVLVIGLRKPFPHLHASGRSIQAGCTGDVEQQFGDGVQRQVRGVRFAECRKHLGAGILGLRCQFPNDTTLADTGRPDESHDAAVAVDRPRKDTGERAHFPLSADETRFGSGQPPTGGHPE